MNTYVVILGVLSLAAILAGVICGGVVACKMISHPEPVDVAAQTSPAADDDTEWIDAEIDLAAVRWAEANNQPPQEAALLSARLKVLHELGRGKGWF